MCSDPSYFFVVITSLSCSSEAFFEFGYIDESLILETFGEAYGMEWLEKYYTDNEFELRGINNDC